MAAGSDIPRVSSNCIMETLTMCMFGAADYCRANNYTDGFGELPRL